MENLLVIVAIIVYSFFAIRWGFRFVNGRWAFLEKPEMKIVKYIIAILLGYVTVGICFLLWCVKTIEKLWR